MSDIKLLNEKLESVKIIMHENISNVLERGEKFKCLVDKTELLLEDSKIFNNNSRKLRNKLWWNNIKGKIIIGLIILIALGIISIVIYEETKK